MGNSIKISNDAVFFVHIPKCAGTSLGSFFSKKLRPSNEFFWHGQDGDINKIAAQKGFACEDNGQGIKFLGGHYTLPTATQIITDTKISNASIFSVIRNPVDQAESYFNWITSESVLKQAAHPLHEHAKNMSPIEFFQDELILAEVGNIQSKYLLGVDCEASNPNEILSLSLSLVLKRQLYLADVNQSDPLAHRVAELLTLSATGAENGTQVPRENVSAARDTKFDQDTIAHVRKLFWGDILMYETLSTAHNTSKRNFYF